MGSYFSTLNSFNQRGKLGHHLLLTCFLVDASFEDTFLGGFCSSGRLKFAQFPEMTVVRQDISLNILNRDDFTEVNAIDQAERSAVEIDSMRWQLAFSL